MEQTWNTFDVSLYSMHTVRVCLCVCVSVGRLSKSDAQAFTHLSFDYDFGRYIIYTATTTLYTNSLCIHSTLCICTSMFVHKFQALDKQNESKNSKKLFFIHQCVLSNGEREREQHLGEENQLKQKPKQHKNN